MWRDERWCMHATQFENWTNIEQWLLVGIVEQLQCCRHFLCPSSSAYVENAPIIEANFTRFSLVLLMKQYYSIVSIVFYFWEMMISYAMATPTVVVFVVDECGNIVSSAIEFNCIIQYFCNRWNWKFQTLMNDIRAFGPCIIVSNCVDLLFS